MCSRSKSSVNYFKSDKVHLTFEEQGMTWEMLSRANVGQPEATFISSRGLWNEEEVGSGRNDWTMSRCLF